MQFFLLLYAEIMAIETADRNLMTMLLINWFGGVPENIVIRVCCYRRGSWQTKGIWI